MAPSKQLLAALLLAALAGPVAGIEGDVLAASDFRTGTQDWSLKGVGTGTGWSNEGLQSEGDVIAAIDSPSDTGKNWYYSAPKAFLGGDKTLAYNGWLVFDFGHFEYESMGMPAMDGYDVYLQAKSKKFTLGLRGVFKADDSKLSNTYSIRLEEDFSPEGSTAVWELVNVVKAVDGRLVTKVPTQHEFITCLQTLTGVWIRGSYFKGSEASWLKDVKIIQGALNKGGNPLGAVATLVNGALVYSDKSAPPAASSTCCSSRTCVSNDKYEISFDRPGCMHSSDMYCCMPHASASESCTGYPVYYDQSKAAEVIRGADYNEGRAYFTPATVDKCKGAGTGQHGSKFSACRTQETEDPQVATADGGPRSTTAYGQKRAQWSAATKNQNMGMKGVPIQKPFVKDYYMGSIPRICSPATLTIEAHGDLADSKDNIMVYGEDDVYLGTIFAGNLTYLKEGQRPYDAYGAATDCDGTYDPNIPGSGENARLADPHHPTGNRPQHKGYRGGRNDVVTPGVQGNEDTRCSRWQPGGAQPLSLQHSESVPYIDSIAISQDRMMQYSADGQIKFTFRSVRDDSAANAFSGTGGGGSTRNCNYGIGSSDCGGVACEGCDLDGKVIFRSIKLKFSAGVCYTKSATNDLSFEYYPQIHTPQNLNISVTYAVPSGDIGQPGGDAAFSVTAGADIFGTDKKLVVYDKDLNVVGELFSRESFQSLRTHMSDDATVMTTAFGAKDSPTPFHLKSNCDTTSPILGSDRCTPADNQWTMGNTLVNYTDTLRIPRENIAKMAVNGKVQLYITADVPANAFSLSADTKARFSPITLAYPLMHCFMKAIKSGPNFGVFLDRPMSYYFKETGFPMPAGDVTVFVAASWQQHVRYVTRHVGSAVSNKFSYDGVEDGLPVMRVDKDTVADMGTVWIYKNSDGEECCPSTHKPTAADGMHVVSGYSNCMGKAAMCTDPNIIRGAVSTEGCTEENPCPLAPVAAGTDATMVVLANTFILDGAANQNLYAGMKMVMYVGLKTGGGSATAAANGVTIGAGAGAGLTVGVYPLKITCPAATPNCGGGAICKFHVDAGGTVASGTECSADGAYTVVPDVGLYATTDPEYINYPNVPASYGAGATLPTFTAVLDDTATGKAALGADVSAGTNVRTIVKYDQATRAFFFDADWAAVPVAAANKVRITANLGEDLRAVNTATKFSRNQRDGGTATGTVAVPLDAASVSCETRVLKSGTIEYYDDGSKTVRLDSEASLFDTAYNGYKIRIKAKGLTAWDARSIVTYSGTIAGVVGTDVAHNLAGSRAFTIKSGSAPAATGDVVSAAGAVSSGEVTQAFLANTEDDFYNGAMIEVDIDGDDSTSDDVYQRRIKDFAKDAALPTVTLAIPLVRRSLLSGTGGTKDDGTASTATAIVLDDLAERFPETGKVTGTTVSSVDDFYNGMYILVDNDGYPETEGDIDFVQISDYVGATGIATVGTLASGAPTRYSTWTIVESLQDLEFPISRSTYRIYNRDAVLDAVITAGTDPTLPVPTALGAAATVGATEIVLPAAFNGADADYHHMKLRISEYGITDEYTITKWTNTGTKAEVTPPLRRSYLATAMAEIVRTYEIYQDLGTECLTNVNMTVTYTYGTARSVSNDPGELSTIYSNWDRALGRHNPADAGGSAYLPEQRDVRSWTLKLAGAGYYSNLYPGEGLGSYDTNLIKGSGAAATGAGLARAQSTAGMGTAIAIADTEITIIGSNAGLQVGQYIKLTCPGGTTNCPAGGDQYEIVKIVGIKDGTNVYIERAQLGTQAQLFPVNPFGTSGLLVTTAGFNRGQGMDEMAELGGYSRYSSSLNDAYTGLWVTIVSGAGAGQTRWIADYHGDSRTVYIGGAPWSIIPDPTSKYKIWYSAEIVEYSTAHDLVFATFPRPVKKGYLVELDWYGCAKDVPESFLNNAWTVTATGARTLDRNYAASQARAGLAECKGQLGMRRPKQGPATVYPRFKVLQTDYVTGVVTDAASQTHLVLDRHAETEGGLYVGRQVIVRDPTGATVRGTSTIMQSWLGGETGKAFTNVVLDQALTGAADNDIYTILPAAGKSGATTISEISAVGDQYTVEEVDVVRYEYPELIQQHREWPHGYSYLQMKAGEDGEHVGNLFLKDYTQYTTESYYTDSITIPKSVFENYVRGQPNGVSGEFPFTLKTPPGKGNIELLSIVIGYPVLKEEDASSYDSTDIETKRQSSHGPPPFFPYSPGWSGVDESARTTRTHPRFQTHAYTSTCGNGVHDAGEYCDDGNQNDGDGCSSACSLEAGWACETVSLQSPSICRKGLVGQRVPDQEVGCKAYACAPPALNAAANRGPAVAAADITAWLTTQAGNTIICSGTPTDATQTLYPTTPVALTDIGTQVPGTHGDAGSDQLLLTTTTTDEGDYVGATLKVHVGDEVDIYTITGYSGTGTPVATLSPPLVRTYVHDGVAAEAVGTQVPGTHGDAGSTAILLGASASATAAAYVGRQLRVIVGGVKDVYTITGYTAGKVATVTPPLYQTYVHNGNNAATYEILKAQFEIPSSIPYGPNYPVCELGGVQGTCTMCINWDSSDQTPSSNADASGVKGGILGSSGVPGFDGSSKRRLLVDTATELSGPAPHPVAPLPSSEKAVDAAGSVTI